jgi:peptidoglycan pentaglycine glycine transferase (the first glycine)
LDEYRADIIRVLEKNGFIKAFEETQPEWRQIIDISQTEEEILNQMKPKGRYNIRLALKHGVKKSQNINRQSQIDIFYRLYKETAKFQNISRRNKKYFESMAKILPENEIDIIIAEYQGEPLSVLLLAFYDGVASYLYGGTSRENKQVMAPYLAHWEAIREARTRDCYKYDLLAVSPEANGGEPGEKRGHKYENLTRFKEQFGGRKVNIVGSWDYIIRPTWYKMFKAAEKIRR